MSFRKLIAGLILVCPGHSMYVPAKVCEILNIDVTHTGTCDLTQFPESTPSNMLYRPSEETQILGRALAEAGFESSKELRPYESKSWVYRNFAALLSRVSDQLDVAREDEQAAEGLRAGVVSILTDYATCTCQDTYLDVSSLSVPQCVEALYSLRSMGIFMNFAVVYMHPSYFYVIEGLIETVHLFSPRNLGGVDGRLFEDNTWLNFEADGLPLLECMDMYCMPTDRLRLLR